MASSEREKTTKKIKIFVITKENITENHYNLIMKDLNVLIVEDDKVIAFDLLRIVKSAGFPNAVIAGDAHSAMQMIRTGPIDILLSDINMETSLSGIALAQKAKECCRIVSVFITAYYDDATLKAVSEVDYAGYIVKPFRDEEVEAVLKIAALRSMPNRGLPDPWHYDESSQLLYKRHKPVVLPPKEKLLFDLLYRARCSIVNYQNIETLLWPNDAVSDNTRRQLFHRFKSRLEGLQIRIVRGEGIVLDI